MELVTAVSCKQKWNASYGVSWTSSWCGRYDEFPIFLSSLSFPSFPICRNSCWIIIINVSGTDGRIRLDPGPYTLVEGFLQLAQPLDSAS